MPINTKATLRTAVASFLNRADLNSQIDTFMELATVRFSDELRTPEMETLVTTVLSGEWAALPSDFRAIKLLEAGGDVLEYVTPWQMQKAVEAQAYKDVPVYTIQDLQFRIYPFPSSTTAELTYYAALADLTSDSSSNWLLLKRPDVYLYATLAQARLFLHDDERIVAAQAFTDKFIAEANRAARNIAIGSAPLAVRAA